MKKTNVMIAIVIAIFVICAAVILLVAINNSTKDDAIPTNVDFDALALDIEELTGIDSTKMQTITNVELQDEFQVSTEWVSRVIGQKPYVNVTSSMYVIVEATDGNVDNIIAAFEKYGIKYDEIWKDYLTEEYELVKNRMIGSKGNYVYFIVSDSAKEIVELIK